MNYIIEGPRMTGKSTMIDDPKYYPNLQRFKDQSYHLNPYSDGLDSEKFFAGKDVALMQMFMQSHCYLIDRFFITSIVFAEFCGRMPIPEKYNQYLGFAKKLNFFENNKFIVFLHTDESIRKVFTFDRRKVKDDFHDTPRSLRKQNEIYKKVCMNLILSGANIEIRKPPFMEK